MLGWIQWVFLFLPLFSSCTPKKRGGDGTQFVSANEMESDYLDQHEPSIGVVLENDYVKVETPLPEAADYVEITVGGETHQTCTEETVFSRKVVESCEGELTCDAEAKVCSSENGGTCSESAEITFIMDESESDDEETVELEPSEAFTAVVNEYETRKQRAEVLQEKACKILGEVGEAKFDENMSFVADQAKNICKMHICSVILSLDEFEDQILDLINQEPSEETELSTGAVIGIALGSTAVVAAAIGMGVGLSPKDKQKKKLSVFKDDPNLDQIKALKKALRENMLRSDQELEKKKKSKAQVDRDLVAARTRLDATIRARVDATTREHFDEIKVDKRQQRARVKELEASQTALGDQIDSLEAENGDLRKVTLKSLAEIELLKADFQGAQEAYMAGEKEMAELKVEHSHILKTERVDIEKKMRELKAQIEGLEDSGAELTAEDKLQLEQLEELELKLKEMEAVEAKMRELEHSLEEAYQWERSHSERSRTLRIEENDLKLSLESVKKSYEMDPKKHKNDKIALLEKKLKKKIVELNKEARAYFDNPDRVRDVELELKWKPSHLLELQESVAKLKQKLGFEQVNNLSSAQKAKIDGFKRDVVLANDKMKIFQGELDEIYKKSGGFLDVYPMDAAKKKLLTRIDHLNDELEKHKRNVSFFENMMEGFRLLNVDPATQVKQIEALKKAIVEKAKATQFSLDSTLARDIQSLLGESSGSTESGGHKKLNSLKVEQLLESLIKAGEEADLSWRGRSEAVKTGAPAKQLTSVVGRNKKLRGSVVAVLENQELQKNINKGAGSHKASGVSKFRAPLTSENPKAYEALVDFIMDLTKAGIENMGSLDKMVENEWNLD